MKVRAILEFDLEDEDGVPITLVGPFQPAADDAEHAIRDRLMGVGFLSDNLLVGNWALRSKVVKAAPSDPDPPP